METLQTLGIALGLASLAGLNLYLTVFATGLAVQLGWITLQPQYASLDILAHPAIVGIAGALYLVEFFADKVPWVDSLWDSVHTVIRPVGGAFLAVRVLGTTDPVFDVVIALLAGTASLMVHGVKAGTRLVANHSPEPFSNVALSVTEDVAVLGGLALINYDPLLALGVFALLLAAICYFGPMLFRAVKVNAWLLWRKIISPAGDHSAAELTASLPSDLHVIFHAANLLGEKIAWAVPCISGGARKIPANLHGFLVTTVEDPAKVWFVAKRGWRHIAEELDLATYKVVHEPKMLSDNLVLYSLEKNPKFLFLFDRTQGPLVEKVAAALQQRIASAAPKEPVASGEVPLSNV